MGPLSFLYYLTPFRLPENNPCSLWIIVFSKSMLNFSCPWTWSQSLCKEHSCSFYVILFFWERTQLQMKSQENFWWGNFLFTSEPLWLRAWGRHCYMCSFSLLFPIWHIVGFFLSLIWEFFFGTNFSNNLKSQAKVTEQVWILERNLLFLIAIAHWIKIL